MIISCSAARRLGKPVSRCGEERGGDQTADDGLTTSHPLWRRVISAARSRAGRMTAGGGTGGAERRDGGPGIRARQRAALLADSPCSPVGRPGSAMRRRGRPRGSGMSRSALASALRVGGAGRYRRRPDGLPTGRARQRASKLPSLPSLLSRFVRIFSHYFGPPWRRGWATRRGLLVALCGRWWPTSGQRAAPGAAPHRAGTAGLGPGRRGLTPSSAPAWRAVRR